MTQPRIKIEHTLSDKIIEGIGLLALLLLVGLPLYYYSSLPDSIPGHYGADGLADRFASKESLWILPIIGVLTYIALIYFNRHPHLFNYSQKITEQNAVQQYRIATKMTRVLMTTTICGLAYITFSTIRTALGKQNGLGAYFLPLFLISIAIIIGYSLYLSAKAK